MYMYCTYNVMYVTCACTDVHYMCMYNTCALHVPVLYTCNVMYITCECI